MHARITTLILTLFPQLHQQDERDQFISALGIFGIATVLPFAVVAVLGLSRETDLSLLRTHGLEIAAVILITFILDAIGFTIYLNPTQSEVAFSGSLSNIISWAGYLVLGPIAVWFSLPYNLYRLVADWPRLVSPSARMEMLRNFVQQVAFLFSVLVGLVVYRALGGSFPFPGLAPQPVLAAIAAVFTEFVVSLLIGAPFFWFISAARSPLIGEIGAFFRQLVGTLALGAVVQLFAILGAGIWVGMGFAAFLAFAIGLVAVSALAYRLSQAVALSAERANAMKHLEALGRAILAAPPDDVPLPTLLQAYLPGMFGRCRASVLLFNGTTQTTLYHTSPDWIVPPETYQRIRETSEPYLLQPNIIVQEDRRWKRDGLLVPIIADHTQAREGAIYLLRSRRLGPVLDLLPLAQALAAQIASVYFRANAHKQEQARKRTEQELEFAAKVQSSFLPSRPLAVPGWQVSAQLTSAKETSGDFYDFIELPNGHIGFVIADVADKGMGAALFMALGRTLIRTCALDCGDDPATTLRHANLRICQDTRSDIFVTVFYGVLNPSTGELVYCNAGHNPPLHVSAQGEAKPLARGGMPLGLFESVEFKIERVHLAPNDRLILFTDGVTEAHNAQQEMFGDERLCAAARACVSRGAAELRDHILQAVSEFVAGADQFDDMTLVVVARDAAQYPA
jgi:serine phosphatase RsbU (regulator of sigma subunit)